MKPKHLILTVYIACIIYAPLCNKILIFEFDKIELYV